jgi:hypothetical protein
MVGQGNGAQSSENVQELAEALTMMSPPFRSVSPWVPAVVTPDAAAEDVKPPRMMTPEGTSAVPTALARIVPSLLIDMFPLPAHIPPATALATPPTETVWAPAKLSISASS